MLAAGLDVDLSSQVLKLALNTESKFVGPTEKKIKKEEKKEKKKEDETQSFLSIPKNQTSNRSFKEAPDTA